MKTTIPVLTIALSVLLFASCRDASDEHEGLQEHDRVTQVQEKEDLSPLMQLNGSYPIEVRLLDNPLIRSRIEQLLGAEYANFRKYWNVETPIVVEDSVLSTTGCEQHNCGANQYVLQIDIKANNINVYHIGNDMRSFQEKGAIQLPPGIAEEFETTKGNM